METALLAPEARSSDLRAYATLRPSARKSGWGPIVSAAQPVNKGC